MVVVVDGSVGQIVGSPDQVGRAGLWFNSIRQHGRVGAR